MLTDNQNPLKQRFGSEFFREIPKRSGVYFFLDIHKKVLYIGKAKHLRNRIQRYSQIKIGNAPMHILKLISRVCFIQWLECESEKEAFIKESELLHAIRPPFNMASIEPDHYLFVGVKDVKFSIHSYKNQNFLRLQMQLSRDDRMVNDGYQIYGCFKNHPIIKVGFVGLLRLLYAATFRGKRFAVPARIGGGSTLWVYSVNCPLDWKLSLDAFLKGVKDNPEFLTLICESLLENECIPGFVRASIQHDLETVQSFYEFGPRKTYLMKMNNRIDQDIISMDQMDRLIASAVASIV